MLITKFVEVPNTNIKEEVLSDFGYDLCYDMAQQYGHAQLVWYALNVTRVVEGEYTDKDLTVHQGGCFLTLFLYNNSIQTNTHHELFRNRTTCSRHIR